MKYRELAHKLRRLGCEESGPRASGSHRKWYNPATGGIATIPDWGAKDLKEGTLHAIVRDLGLSWQDFLKTK
jgi:mRNA interferase HicA